MFVLVEEIRTPASWPLVSFAETGNSVLVQRNIPEPVAYRGTSLIELRLAEGDDEKRSISKARAFEANAMRLYSPDDAQRFNRERRFATVDAVFEQ